MLIIVFWRWGKKKKERKKGFAQIHVQISAALVGYYIPSLKFHCQAMGERDHEISGI